jgi:hypothetical protein
MYANLANGGAGHNCLGLPYPQFIDVTISFASSVSA